MTWPHWYGDGITGQYRVMSFPTVVVIDAKGIIRSLNARGAERDKLVDDLAREAEAKWQRAEVVFLSRLVKSKPPLPLCERVG